MPLTVFVAPYFTTRTIIILANTRRCISSGIKKFILPDIGEGIKEVEVKDWQVKVGDRVKEFDPICDVESDKATATISSRYEGRITKIYYEVGETAAVGQPLVDIELQGAPGEDPPQKETIADTMKKDTTKKDISDGGKGEPNVATLPSVRQMAKQRNIDLTKVVPTGKYGHVLKDDVLKYIEDLQRGEVTPQLVGELHPEEQSETRKPLRGIRKAMLKTMTNSLAIPHCPYIEKIDLTRLDETSAKHKIGKFPIIIKMVSLALCEYPQLNASLDYNGEPSLIFKHSHNIGIAIDTEFGLVVPNIKNVQNLTIVEIKNELLRLRELAYSSKLSIADSTGGTITLSNIGAIGSGMGVPTILPPEILIGALGRAEKYPLLNSNGQWEAKNVMPVVWSADHRVVDGATLARFSKLLKMYLEEPDSSLIKLK